MKTEEYKLKLKEIEAEYGANKKALDKEYALSNAKFKVGDIIKGERWTIKVDTISTYVWCGEPEPVYRGYELKKDLTPKKSMERQSIHGNNAELIKP